MRGLIVAFAIVLAGCSHTFFQFHIDQNSANAIEQNKMALAATAGNPGALAQVVDLEGRRAAETLVAGMTVESTSGDVQYQRLTRALYLGIMGDGVDPVNALTSDVTFMAAQVAQRIAINQASQFGLGGLAQMVGMVTDNDGVRLGEMSASLQRGGIAYCQGLDPIISYNAGILGHIHSQLAESDQNYLAWRGRVQSIHLVHYVCGQQHAVMVFTQNAGEPGVRAIGWHFMRADQWERFRPQLRYALDLPN
jgi:hypothetical protein